MNPPVLSPDNEDSSFGLVAASSWLSASGFWLLAFSFWLLASSYQMADG
jgi:hypothetical protein